MSLNVKLDHEYEEKLIQILAITRMNKSQLARKMITDQWIALQADKSFVERRGGHPKRLLNDSTISSERSSRKIVLANHFIDKASRRAKD
jgi:hypothetical protein